MLKPKKKIAKREIKEDTLLTAYANATTLYYDYKKYFWNGLTVLAVVIIGLVFYANNRRSNSEKAASEFGKVFSIYDAAANDPQQYKVAINGQPERGIMGLKGIVDNYGGSDAGELARFYLASAYYFTGQYDDALAHFDKFSGGTDQLKASALAGMAACYEVKREYGKASSYYEKAARQISDRISTPEYLSHAARCYGLSGEKEKAVTLFKKIKKEYPTSTAARDADRYIAQFSA